MLEGPDYCAYYYNSLPVLHKVFPRTLGSQTHELMRRVMIRPSYFLQVTYYSPL